MATSDDARVHDSGGLLRAGWRELGRRFERLKLARELPRKDAERSAALVSLGRQAWEHKLDLTAFPGLREQLTALEARTGDLSRVTEELEARRAELEEGRRSALEDFAARRRTVEQKKAPVDTVHRDVRSRKAACEQRTAQSQTRLVAITTRLSELDREIVALDSTTAPDAQARLQAVREEQQRITAEQEALDARLAQDRDELAVRAAEDSRLEAESAALGRELEAIDAERKAAIDTLDSTLARVRSEAHSTTQQSGSVQKERSEAFASLGLALHESGTRDAAIADACTRIDMIDHERAGLRSRIDASAAESASLPGGTMPKFWGVTAGLPLLLAALASGLYLHYQAPETPEPATTAAMQRSRHLNPAAERDCEVRSPPRDGKGVGVTPNCTRSEGTFHAGLLEGKGHKTWLNGESLEGIFHNDLLSGEGVRVYADGRRFEGPFVENNPVGYGTLTLEDGTSYEGMFQGPTMLGFGVRRGSDGEIVAGDWRAGVDGSMYPFGLMLRVRADGTREKIDAAVIDPRNARKIDASGDRQPVSGKTPY